MNLEMVKKIALAVLPSHTNLHIVGHPGVGKTATVSSIAQALGEFLNKNINLYEIDGSHIKEGEITGIPIISTDEETGQRINEYTLYYVFNEALKNEAAGEATLIFIDELNRTTKETFGEMMNILLQRKIQTTELPDSVYFITAGNPDDEGDFQVLEMDSALKDRMFIVNVESDFKCWLKWAVNNVSDLIVEFLTEHEDCFHVPIGPEDIRPTPRGWDLLSRALRFVKEDDYETILALANAKVGPTASNALMSYIRERKNPIPKYDELISMSDASFKKTLEKIKEDSNIRNYTLCMRYVSHAESDLSKMDSKKHDKQIKKIVQRLVDILSVTANDLKFGVTREIMNASTDQYSHLYDGLFANDDFSLNIMAELKKFKNFEY